jgi:molybdenum cofactor biosynthesis protein B
MGHREHRLAAPIGIPCAVVTASDTRTPATDASGAVIRALLERQGHRVVDYRVLPDDPRRIATHLRRLARAGLARVVLVTGGTGIAPRDTTYEAIERLLEKRLPGFGEVFRYLSYRQIGPAAILSRAIAGTCRGMIVFSMPGSEPAVRLAMTRLILPEIGHAAGLLAAPPTRRGRRRVAKRAVRRGGRG